MDQQPLLIATIPTPAWYSSWYFRLFVLVCIGIFIYIKVRPYINKLLVLIETTRSLLNTLLNFTEDVSESVVDETAVGAKLVVNKLSTPLPEPDESVNQTKPSSGYCLVGEWKGVRSCAKIDNGTCRTTMYSTEQSCVNPTLR